MEGSMCPHSRPNYVVRSRRVRRKEDNIPLGSLDAHPVTVRHFTVLPKTLCHHGSTSPRFHATFKTNTLCLVIHPQDLSRRIRVQSQLLCLKNETNRSFQEAQIFCHVVFLRLGSRKVSFPLLLQGLLLNKTQLYLTVH